MSEPALLDVAVAGGSLRAGVWGPLDGSRAIVVAAHGITANHLSWATVARALGGDVALVAVDLRGRGASGGLPGPYGMAAHARDVVAVLDHLGLARAVVAGHSMGCYVAAVLAADVAPERVASLVLVDGGLPLPRPAGTEDLDPDAVLDATLGPAIARLSMTFASVDEYLAMFRAHPAFGGGGFTDDVERYFRYDLAGEPPTCRSRVNEAAVRADGTEIFVDDGVRLALDRVGAPVTILRAPKGLFDEPNPLLSDGAVAAFQAAHPGARVIEAAGTNHYTITLGEGAAAVAAAIRDAAVSAS